MKKSISFIAALVLLLSGSYAQTGIIYLNFGSHNEVDDPITYTVSASYAIFKPIVRQIADTIIKKKAKWNMQVESNFVRADILNDAGSSSTSDLLEVLDTSAYIEIDAHNHYNVLTNPYNYPDMVKMLGDVGITNRKTMGGFIWYSPLQDWTQYQVPVAGHTFTSYTWTPTIMWGAGSPGHVNDFNAFGIWKPLITASITAATFVTQQPSSPLTSMGNGTSNVLWTMTSADSISNNIINLVNQIATGQISQTGFYTQTIMFNFKSINTTTAAGYVSKITEIINDLQPYVDQGKIIWQNLSEKNTTWNTLHPSSNDYFVLQASSVPAVLSAMAVSPSSLSSFSTTVGTPSTVQSFSLSASWVTANIVVTAPTNFQVSLNSTSGFATSMNITPTNGALASTLVYARYNPSSAGTHTGNITVNTNGNVVTSKTVTVSGTSSGAASSMTVAPLTLSSFSTTVGTPSSVSGFTVSGSVLTSNVTVTAPANFEISLTASTGFGTSANITPTSGSITNTIVYARYNPSAAGSHNGNILISATGVMTQTVTVSGTSSAPAGAYLMITMNSLTTFSTVVGTPSSSQYFGLDGGNLSANVSVVAPNDFEVSASSSSGFVANLFLTPTSGTLSATVYVRYNPSAAGAHNGKVIVTSLEASASYSVAVSGISTPDGIEDLDGNNFYLSVAPNPVNQVAIMSWQVAKTADVSLEVLDVTGKKVYSNNLGKMNSGKYDQTIDMKNFVNGIYFLKLNIDGNTAVKQIVKNGN